MLELDNGYVEMLPAAQSRPLLGRELRNAYKIFASVRVDGLERMIAHSPASHAPATKLPWPFSKLGMHDVEIRYFKADGGIETNRFSKDMIDQAIEEFLSGVPPDAKVQINVEHS
jgi:hypothetical protein